MTDHANKTLPLPAYLAEDAVLLDLLAAARECAGGPTDTATPAFIAAAEQELEDRGTDLPRAEVHQPGPKESLVFANGRWEFGSQHFNATTRFMQWERRDGSFICAVGQEEASQPMPGRPERKSRLVGDAEIYDVILAAKRGITEPALAEKLGCSRDDLRPGLLRLYEAKMAFNVYAARGMRWHADSRHTST